MANFDTGPVYAAIGQLLAEDVRAAPEGTFLYAEVGSLGIDCAIYKAIGRRVVYRTCSPELIARIGQVRRMEARRERWQSMAYTITAGRFTVDLRYPDQLDRRETFADRSTAAVKQRFGARPVDTSDP